MRRAFPWLLLGAGFVTLVAIVLFGGSQTPPPSTHSSFLDTADGTSALYKAASSGDRHVSRLYGGSPAPGGLLLIFSPSSAYSAQAAANVSDFVERGGTLVYASEQPDPELDQRLGILRESGPVRDLVAYAPGPLLQGVHEVSGGAVGVPFAADTNQVPILRGPLRETLAFEAPVGKGHLIALSDPLVLCNGYLLRSDNAAFAADILGLVPPGGQVVFDESHHAAASQAEPPPAAPARGGPSPWVWALIWAVALVYVGLALRGRGFGPPIPLLPPRARSTAEYVDAVGTLLKRSGGRRQAAEILLNATRRGLGRRLGGRTLPADRVGEVLEQRQPALAERLRAAEHAAAAADGSEAALLETARNLHELESIGGGRDR